jgi:hypothetical protein
LVGVKTGTLAITNEYNKKFEELYMQIVFAVLGVGKFTSFPRGGEGGGSWL